MEGPLNLTFANLIEAQKGEDFYQTGFSRQDRSKDSDFFEDKQGLLQRMLPMDPFCMQIVLSEALRPRLVCLTHFAKLAGHPGWMYETLKNIYLWYNGVN